MNFPERLYDANYPEETHPPASLCNFAILQLGLCGKLMNMLPLAQTPRDLANRLQLHLSRKSESPPLLDHLTALLEAAFFASMQTEESQPIRCTLAFVDPGAPDPQRPQKIRPHRWTVVPLAEPVPLSINSLTKLAQAAPFEASAIAVYVTADSKPIIWGLVDQELHTA